MPILAAGPKAPFAVDAIVLEEDRWLVLSAPPIVRESKEHPVRIHTSLVEAEPRALGSVIEQPGRLLAVVHDLDRESTTTLFDVEAAWARVLEICEERGFKRLGVPLLGAVHGRLDRGEALGALARALSKSTQLTAVWLMTEDENDLETLRSAFTRPSAAAADPG